MNYPRPKEQSDWSDHAAQRLAAIVQSSRDAIISKDIDGIVTSWNPAATRLLGYQPEEIIGKSILTIIPEALRHEEDLILERIRRGEQVDEFETKRVHKSGEIKEVCLSVSPIFNGVDQIVGASKMMRDVSARRQQERELSQQRRRLEQVDRLSKIIARERDLGRAVQLVTDIATEAADAEFGAFFYNLVDAEGERYTLYTLSGAPSEAFEGFGMPRNTAVFAPTFDGIGVVRSADIRQDPRYGKSCPHFGMPKGHLPVVSYLAVPVLDRTAGVLGGLFFAHREPGVFTQEAEDLVVGIAAHAAIAFENARLHKAAQDEIARRRHAEETSELLLRESHHRIKNTLAMVQAIAAQTLQTAPVTEKSALAARLNALGAAHDLLIHHDWDSANLEDIVEQTVAPFRAINRDRVRATGPNIILSGNDAVFLAMVLHELATNAVKYGALSTAAGQVSVSWQLSESSGKPFVGLTWLETGGPRVVIPARKGFGTALLRQLQNSEGNLGLEFKPEGVRCYISVKAKS